MYVASLVITGGDNSGTVACDEVPNSNSKFVSVFTIKRPKGEYIEQMYSKHLSV